MLALVWHRGDLRTHDHPALWAAVQQGELLPVVIIDTHIFARATLSARRKAWFLTNLAALRAHYRQLGSDVLVRVGMPEHIVPTLAAQYQAQTVHALASYTPYGKTRDHKVRQALAQVGVTMHSHAEGIAMRDPNSITNQKSEPYRVYSPYRNRWRSLAPLTTLPSPTRLPPLPPHIPADALGTIPEHASDIPLPPAGEQAAQQQLHTFLARAQGYAEQRNQMSNAEGTSQLSPYLTLGVLSARYAFIQAEQAATRDPEHAGSYHTWQNELIWRDFNISLLHHFPHIAQEPFQDKWQGFPWHSDTEHLRRWQQGQTGYPLVDAGMRQLADEGFMHNRVRMVVASFLSKHLLLDWRAGEQHFKTFLLDGDTANNLCNWQWAAGTGADAQPYFRIFNPISQVKKFSAYAYLRRYVPELAKLPDSALAFPEPAARRACGYPTALIDHAEARARYLALTADFFA